MNVPQGTHPDVREWQAFDRGLLEPGRSAALEQHLAVCPECARRLAELPDETMAELLREYDATLNTPPFSETSVLAEELPPVLRDHPRYRVLDVLGRGGMGVVYRAEHRLMGRTVALKVLDPRLTGKGSVPERFRQEMQVAARLAHPNVVAGYDAEEAGGTFFLVMEYVQGETLDSVLRRGRVGVTEACDWVRQAALGLHHAHVMGLVHRDVKPSNLILTRDGQVKVLDFGLAHLVQRDLTDPALTPEGAVLGTPAYLAPEQARNPGSADVRADVYGLGCTLYHLLAGEQPFPTGTAIQQLLAHQDQPPPRLTGLRPEVPEALDRLVARMMAKAPADRPHSAAEVARALEPFVAGDSSPLPRRRRRVVAVIGLAVALATVVGVGWYIATRPGKPVDPPPRVEPAPPPAARPPVRELAERWLKANNSLGPDSPLVPDCVRKIEAADRLHRLFTLRLGQGLVRSGQRTMLVGRDRSLGVFELTAEQAGFWPIEQEVVFFTASNQDLDDSPEPWLELSDLAIDAAEMAYDRPLTGSVAYRRLRPLPGKVSLIFSALHSNTTRTMYDPDHRQPSDESGRVRFSFVIPFDNVPPGPVTAMLEAVRREGDGNKMRLVSNGLTVVLLYQRREVLNPVSP